MDLCKYRRKATPEELQEGQRQIEEAEERLAKEGVIYIGDTDPRGAPSSREGDKTMITPVARALPFSPLSGQVFPEVEVKKKEEAVRDLRAGESLEEPTEAEEGRRLSLQ